MERYFRAFNKYREKFLNMNNVVGVGVGYKNIDGSNIGSPAYIIYVDKKMHQSDLSRSHIIPRQLDGLETDVVEIGKIRMLDLRTSRSRPCQPGMSIGHYQSTAGTLGAIVRDKSTKELMILSNNHVIANGSSVQEIRAKPGDSILQPGPYDGGTSKDRIGVLHRYIPLQKNVAKSDCPVAVAVAGSCTKMIRLVKPDYEMRFYKNFSAENIVDCAVAKLDSPDIANVAVLEIGEINGMAEAKLGDTVQKSGRTTGLTGGIVKSVGTTLQVEMREEEKVWFTDQVVTDVPSQPGDSGALIINERRQAVGLLFAGSDKLTIFNRIYNVVNCLGIEFV